MLGVQPQRSEIEVELGYKYHLSMPGHNPWWYTWRAQLALPRNWRERTQVRLYPTSGGDLRPCSSDRLSRGSVVSWGREPHEPSRENQECGRREVLSVGCCFARPSDTYRQVRTTLGRHSPRVFFQWLAEAALFSSVLSGGRTVTSGSHPVVVWGTSRGGRTGGTPISGGALCHIPLCWLGGP